MRLGTATDTYNATGKITQTGDASHITREKIISAMSLFTNDIMQIPPM